MDETQQGRIKIGGGGVSVLLLVITAVIWGLGFVAQKEGLNETGPLTFCVVRWLISFFVQLPLIFVLDRAGITRNVPKSRDDKRKLIKVGIACGSFVALINVLQMYGLAFGTSAGKAGFITTCYIVFVPILGAFIGRKCGRNALIAVVLTLIGLYMLCITGDFDVQMSDMIVLACAFANSFQILTIDKYANTVDVVRLAVVQSLAVAILTLPFMFVFEVGASMESLAAWASSFASPTAWIPLLYAGVFAGGLAYLFQCMGQQGIDPTVASLLMSLESVFAVVGGCLLLGESLSMREAIGCVVIAVAVVLAQIPTKRSA